MATPRLIAHRGFAAAYPQNTLTAFRGALTHADRLAGIEMDIQVTADGKLIVLHDRKLLQDDGGRLDVSSLAVHELAQHPQVQQVTRGEPLPTLEQALLTIRHQTTIYIEIKESVLPADHLIKPLRESLTRYEADESVILMSFDWRWIETAMAKLDLPVRYACLFTDATQLAQIPTAIIERCSYLLPNAQALLHDANWLADWPQPLNPWTVNDRQTLQRLLAAPWAERLHAITTDHPDLLSS